MRGLWRDDCGHPFWLEKDSSVSLADMVIMILSTWLGQYDDVLLMGIARRGQEAGH